MTEPRKRCDICETLPGLIPELDAVLIHSDAWPEIIEAKEAGRSTSGPALRSMQVKRALRWLTEKGHADITPQQVRRHIESRADAVPDILDLIPRAEGAVQLMSFYSEAIALGREAVLELRQRLADDPVALTPSELLALASLGGRYAASAAMLRQRGQSPLPGDEGYVPPAEPEKQLPPPPPALADPDDGFLAGSAPAPSKRIGHSRMRVIEGVSRPVHDEGPKDRENYNRTADQEGSPRL